MATRYEQIFTRRVSDNVIENVHDRTGYSRNEIIQAHLEIFLAMPGMDEENPRIRYGLWANYIDVMVKGGISREDRLDFFSRAGTHILDFEWDEWRAAMGYERTRK